MVYIIGLFISSLRLNSNRALDIFLPGLNQIHQTADQNIKLRKAIRREGSLIYEKKGN